MATPLNMMGDEVIKALTYADYRWASTTPLFGLNPSQQVAPNYSLGPFYKNIDVYTVPAGKYAVVNLSCIVEKVLPQIMPIEYSYIGFVTWKYAARAYLHGATSVNVVDYSPLATGFRPNHAEHGGLSGADVPTPPTNGPAYMLDPNRAIREQTFGLHGFTGGESASSDFTQYEQKIRNGVVFTEFQKITLRLYFDASIDGYRDSGTGYDVGAAIFDVHNVWQISGFLEDM